MLNLQRMLGGMFRFISFTFHYVSFQFGNCLKISETQLYAYCATYNKLP